MVIEQESVCGQDGQLDAGQCIVGIVIGDRRIIDRRDVYSDRGGVDGQRPVAIGDRVFKSVLPEKVGCRRVGDRTAVDHQFAVGRLLGDGRDRQGFLVRVLVVRQDVDSYRGVLGREADIVGSLRRVGRFSDGDGDVGGHGRAALVPEIVGEGVVAVEAFIGSVGEDAESGIQSQVTV